MNALATPQVSVVIPTFCRPATTVRALQSVAAQTFSDFEIIVVDDGSTDDTAEIIERSGIEKLRLIRHPSNRGPAAARNTGVAAAKGRWIAFLDSDDEWRPEKLERQVERLRSTPPEVMACSTGYHLHKGGRELTVTPRLPLGAFQRDILFGCTISPGTTLMVAREVFDEIGPFDDSLKRLEDWDWLLRFARRYDIAVLPEALADIHLTPLQVSEGAGRSDPVFDAIDKIRSKHLPLQKSRLHAQQLASSLLVEKAAHMYRCTRPFHAAFYVLAAFVKFPYRNVGFFRTLYRSVASLLVR